MFYTFFLLTALGSSLVLGFSYTTIYMKENCDRTASLGSSGYIEWERNDRYYDHRADCSVILKTGISSERIALQFIDIDIEENGQSYCYDYLYLYEGAVSSFDRTAHTKAICNSQRIVDYTSSTSAVTLRLVTDSSTRGSFKILYTTYMDAVGSGCYGGRYLCSNYRCIHSELKCDRMDNCGDASDEPDDCRTGYPLSRCANEDYVDSSRLCNGAADCSDGSDEWTNSWALCPAQEMRGSCASLVTLQPGTSGYIVYSRHVPYSRGTDCTVQYNTQSGYVIRLESWDVSGMDYNCHGSLFLCNGITGSCDSWENDFSLCHTSPDDTSYVTSGEELTVRLASDWSTSGNFKIFYKIEQGGTSGSSTVVTVVVVILVVILVIAVSVYCCGKKSRSEQSNTVEDEAVQWPGETPRDNIHLHPTTIVHTDRPRSLGTPTIERVPPQPSPRQYSYPSAPPQSSDSIVPPSVRVEPPTPSTSTGEPPTPPPSYDQALWMPTEPPSSARQS
ncbi:LRP3 [Branchiostoma lanceolatum]|uniref:LRP3 protein n=1 Tax=Branchiostoma lanceolatum TaxID=7740 RepID=A0A8J9YNK5_BRALA|nr:LRP3 [Branchiostoma lanceolatum]